MNNINRVLIVLCLSLVIIFASGYIMANDLEIFVTIDNGDNIEFDEDSGMPFAEDGRTLVPLRRAMESLDVEVEWNQELQQAELYQNDITVIVPLNKNYILVDDEEVEIDKEATVLNERIYLPIRFVCEGFGYTVLWNQDDMTVEIYTDEPFVSIEENIPEGLDDIEENDSTNAELVEGVTYLCIRESKGGKIYDKISYPKRLCVLKKSGSWYEIDYDGETRFVSSNSDYVVLDDDAEIEEEEFNFGDMVTWNDVTVDCSGTRWEYAIRNSDNLNEQIYEVANEYGIEPVLIKLICAWESNGHLSEAYLKTNSGVEFYGLMQVHYGNRKLAALVHNDFPRMLTDVVYSLEAGCDMLLIHSNYGKLSMFDTMQPYGSTYKNTNNKIYDLYEQLSGKSKYDSIFIGEHFDGFDESIDNDEEETDESVEEELLEEQKNLDEEVETEEDNIEDNNDNIE